MGRMKDIATELEHEGWKLIPGGRYRMLPGSGCLITWDGEPGVWLHADGRRTKYVDIYTAAEALREGRSGMVVPSWRASPLERYLGGGNAA